jgi:signal transduction histidine kinase/HAMP domain-containing protein
MGLTDAGWTRFPLSRRTSVGAKIAAGRKAPAAGRHCRLAETEPRGRLFRKYVVLVVGLVSGALLASGLIEIYFSYRENRAALVAVQQEKALAAASRIEQFIKEIERQVGWASQPQLGPRPATLDLRRFDFLRLLRQVPAITEISQLDVSGREQLRVSRLAMDVVGSQADFSADPSFRDARAGKTYFGPVYFRKESEPYMTLAIAGSGAAGVTVAEVNLKFIWDVVSQIKAGEAGYAFVADARGQLIAHPDISLVLQKTEDFSRLPQVRAARASLEQPGSVAQAEPIGLDRAGKNVLTAHAAIVPPGWFVFVEQPQREAFEPLYASISRTAGLVVVGLVLAVLASLFLARRMVTPIRALRDGAARIGAGALDHRLAVQTNDELEALANQFNRMAGQLQASYANLEHKVEERTRELSEALEQQTATAEILRVISRSQTDVQPVFDVIARSAVKLCDGVFSAVFRFDGSLVHLVAHHGQTPEGRRFLESQYPMPPDPRRTSSRAILTRAVVHVPDLLQDPAYAAPQLQDFGWRAMLAVPLMREGESVGSINVARHEPGPFSSAQITLVQTFADQAVIAIENARLLSELQARTAELTRSVEELRALGEVSRAVSSTLDVEAVLDTIVSRASQLAGADGCTIYEYDEASEQFHLRATHNLDAAFVEAIRAVPLRKDEGLMGRATEIREPAQIPDITQPASYQSRVREALLQFGYRALLSVPLLREDQIIGSLSLSRKAPGAFPPEVIDVLKTFATQSALAIQNARLFREIEDKSRQLEVANRHKSEFLANMSHELRTPLNAIIGFSEVLVEQMFGKLNPKQLEYLEDIHSSGRHLLSLINDILDLSKVEAGRMELELSTFDLPIAIENALTLVSERASRQSITLQRTVDGRLGEFVGDERKFKQILLNLLSNAVKFTPEGGRVAVRAALANGVVEVSVSDTGIGIAPEDQEAIFEEFRQVGRYYAHKREGTGLGLTLTRKFVELHGGRIWVESEPGRGSTFTFALPVRVGSAV